MSADTPGNTAAPWWVGLDIPTEALPGLPPLPPDLHHKLQHALARPAAHQPHWPNPADIGQIRSLLENVPPVTLPAEVTTLRQRLAQVAHGEAFLLQGGDGLETFATNFEPHIRGNIRTLLQMAVVLTYAASTPIVKIATIAGHYATAAAQDPDADGLPPYRGDLVNSLHPSEVARRPDPSRLVRSYANSTAAMNLVRAMTTDGTSDLHRVHDWNKDFLRTSSASARYESLATEIDRALRFMSACDVSDPSLENTEIFVSHEALVLDYERAMLRMDASHDATTLFNLSSHQMWIGAHTAQLDGAHIALAEILANPVAVELGPHTTPDDVVAYAKRLDPQHIAGRLTFVPHLGHRVIRDVLPPLVDAARAAGHPVIWQCDPMRENISAHGSSLHAEEFDRILDEVHGFFEVHRDLGTHPGGIRLEFTSDAFSNHVGAQQTTPDRAACYNTVLGPRLSAQQSLELAFLIAEMLRP